MRVTRPHGQGRDVPSSIIAEPVTAPTSGDAPSATRKAPAAHPRSTRPASDPPESRRETGTHHRPAAPTQNLYPRRRTSAVVPPATHIHAGRPTMALLMWWMPPTRTLGGFTVSRDHQACLAPGLPSIWSAPTARDSVGPSVRTSGRSTRHVWRLHVRWRPCQVALHGLRPSMGQVTSSSHVSLGSISDRSPSAYGHPRLGSDASGHRSSYDTCLGSEPRLDRS